MGDQIPDWDASPAGPPEDGDRTRGPVQDGGRVEVAVHSAQVNKSSVLKQQTDRIHF